MIRICVLILCCVTAQMSATESIKTLSDLLPGVWMGYSTEDYDTVHWRIHITKFGKEFRGQGVCWLRVSDDIAMSVAKGNNLKLSDRAVVIGEEFRIVVDGNAVIMSGGNLKIIGKDKNFTADNFHATLSAPGYLLGHAALKKGPKAPTTQIALCKEDLWNKPGQDNPAVGRTTDMTCEGLPYHYKLHVPKGYDPAKAWPLIIHFSPGGNASPYDTTFADEVGWVSVGLTESKNGDWGPIVQNRDAALFDLRRRINIDWKRVTFGGESGGSRASAAAWEAHQSITCSLFMIIAGNVTDELPMPPASVPIFFITGKTDMNRKEVEASYQASLKLKRPTELIMHDGGHTSGGNENVSKGLRWLWEHQPKTSAAIKK